ncbi:MAG: ribonuclease E activity regulator RraA [Advenella sp.]|jgi:regulator of ribonuclease activity A|nr:ribonuclease E activity regulator RraA [Advenella sp.]
MSVLLTCDVMDAFPESASCDLQFQQWGKRKAMSGWIRTLKVYEDNTLVRQVLSEKSSGEILVVDGGASLHRALVGDMIATLAMDNGWAGIIVSGAIRDSAQINNMDFSVKALGTNPRKSHKAGQGVLDIPVMIGGVVFRSGWYLYSDADGIVMTENPVVL